MKKIILAIFIPLLTACGISKLATINTDEVTSGQKGVIFGETSGIELAGKRVDLVINGQKYLTGSNQSDSFAAILPAGQHKLEKIITTLNTGSTIYTNTYPINKNFTITAGRVTNLGLMFFAFRQIPSLRTIKNDSSFAIHYVNNSSRANTLFESSYNNLYQALPNKNFIPDSAVSKDAKKLEQLRKFVALQKIQHSLYLVQQGRRQLPYSGFTYGELGSVSVYNLNKNGKLQSFSLLKTDILTTIRSCYQLKGRFACWLSDTNKKSLMLYNNRKAKDIQTLKNITTTPVIYLFSSDGIMLVNENKGEAYISNNNGKNWSTSKIPVNNSVTNIPINNSLTLALGNTIIYEGTKGLYLLSKKENKLFHLKPRANQLTPFALPANAKKINAFLDTQKGYYAGPEYQLIGKANYYFREHNNPNWKTYKTPVARCSNIKTLDNNKGVKLSMDCGFLGGKKYISNNAGKTWSLVE